MSLFIQLPIVSTRNYGQVSPDDISPLFAAEADLWGRFEFKNNLVASNNKNLILTPQQAGTHTLNSNYLTFNTEKGKALVSSFKTSDYADKGVTVCGVFRIPTLGTAPTANQVLFGDHPAFGYHTGFQREIASNQQKILVGSVKPGVNNVGPTDAVNDQWVFLAMTIDRSALTNYATLNKNGIIDNFVNGTSTQKWIDSPYPVALGCSYYTSSARTVDCAEFSIYTKYMTRAEMNDAYLVAKSRMALKGFSI